MREKPILFSTEMVKAILENRKHQTRRVIIEATNEWQFESLDVNPDMIAFDKYGCEYAKEARGTYATFHDCANYSDCEFPMVKSKYEVSDILWVRETHRFMGFESNTRNKRALVKYRDESNQWVVIDDYRRYLKFTNYKDGWKPSIHMPREAARIFLEVVSVRVERLQDISEIDAVAEGAVKTPHYMKWGGEKCVAIHKRYKTEFANLWDSINAKRSYSWKSNPWVWVIEFKRIKEVEK